MSTWTSVTTVTIEEKGVKTPFQKFLENYNDLVNKGGDTREFDFYFNQLCIDQNDNIDDLLKEIFVLLKLQYSDDCPDFATLDREKLEAKVSERNRKLAQRTLLQENRNKSQEKVFDQAWNWIENCINAYEFIHKNQGKYKINKLPLWAREPAYELVECKYVKRSFWGWLSIKSTQSDEEAPFVDLNWISHISENLLAEYKDAAEEVLFADEFYGIGSRMINSLKGGLERNIKISLNRAIEEKLKMMDIQ